MELGAHALNIRYGIGRDSLGPGAQKGLDEAIHLITILEGRLNSQGRLATDSLRTKSLARIREILKPYRIRP